MNFIIGTVTAVMCFGFVVGVIKTAQARQRYKDFPWDDLG